MEMLRKRLRRWLREEVTSIGMWRARAHSLSSY
jgi:hypothetical protein